MTRLLAALFLALAALPTPSTAYAAELVFVEVMGCVYCIRFNRQMADAYQASETGKQVPLRRVNLRQRWPADLRNVDRPPYTPVFILVENGAEIGRFNGYTNPQRFKRELASLLGRPR
ncbi:MAG: transcriptional regulator [Rhizobiaceae bacterium]|nr:transcriptional regulator [Rhizobiaceae bacterium]